MPSKFDTDFAAESFPLLLAELGESLNYYKQQGGSAVPITAIVTHDADTAELDGNAITRVERIVLKYDKATAPNDPPIIGDSVDWLGVRFSFSDLLKTTPTALEAEFVRERELTKGRERPRI